MAQKVDFEAVRAQVADTRAAILTVGPRAVYGSGMYRRFGLHPAYTCSEGELGEQPAIEIVDATGLQLSLFPVWEVSGHGPGRVAWVVERLFYSFDGSGRIVDTLEIARDVSPWVALRAAVLYPLNTRLAERIAFNCTEVYAEPESEPVAA